jgi:3-isopropylmalate dehydrogenase
LPTLNLALLPGDGIGADVIHETVRVLRALEQVQPDLKFDCTEYSVGAGEYLKSGDPLPPATLEKIASHDAILLGAMGMPSVRWPNGVEMTPQIDIREKLDLFCGLRPIRLYHSNDTPLKGVDFIDFVLVRESTEGLFWKRHDKYSLDQPEAFDTMRISRAGSERLFRSAFEQAMLRRKKVTLVDKANVLPSMAYFRGVFDEIAREYPEVETERVYVDAMSLFLVQRPGAYDVLVTENMFGDILSDLAAGLIGGMGMAPSADIGPSHAVFQPSHGSAPDIAGKGIANPVATILSARMMLEWWKQPEAAARVEKAVRDVFSDPAIRTRDMGGSVSTSEMGSRIVDRILANQ